jgi:hypothetical protein
VLIFFDCVFTVGNKSKPRRRLSSSSQSGSDIDYRRQTERTPSPSGSDDEYERKAGSMLSQSGWDYEYDSQSGEPSAKSGSHDNKSDSSGDRESTRLRKEAEKDQMCVQLELDILEKVAPSVKLMRPYWEFPKPGPLSSKPGMSKAIVEPSTSKAIVEPSTSKAVKRPRLDVYDENLLGDSSPPKGKRMTKVRLEREAQERAQEEAWRKAEVAKKHERRLLEKNELRTGIRKNQNIPPKKVNTDRAKLNMQKKADERKISESDKYNKLYYEIKSWNDGDFRHGRGFYREKAISFTVKEQIGVKRFILKVTWAPVDIFLNMFGRPNQAKLNSETLDRLLNATNDYIEGH